MTLAAVLVLAAGTYAFRLAGPLLRDRLALPDRARELLSMSATVLLVALVATSSLTRGQGFAGWALPIGVLVGGLAAWRRAPFVVVVVLAAATTAGLRLLGL
ncbi:AzlD domain-containing protein [Saccharothrix algeriensis]|uniref:AzlD domain-containing protein n=1 Tax=Saccharothrix algeriensis TaxID=173560 RepID=A0A8T8HZ70_9PSEU|nr:AzlD domain-containing protein [Saccharothrix algeriensis]MBM7809571.1 branched-subunit amino acid transport protein [Saccharothrix algeriensis]QTR03885.1 AzlD domain-containing protein [Saccharothrix algeriensis]